MGFKVLGFGLGLAGCQVLSLGSIEVRVLSLGLILLRSVQISTGLAFGGLTINPKT